MKPSAAALLFLALLAWPAWVQAAPAAPPEPQLEVTEPVTAQARFKLAEELLAKGQVQRAIAALREGLVMAPAEVDARLRLANLLMAQRQTAEAVPELRTVLRLRPDAKTYEALVSALQTAGSPIDLAMTAEEALAHYPGQVALTRIAVEALIAVDAPDRALKYWQTLPQTGQTSARGQWLLGNIREANGQPEQAYTAYQLAAAAEPKAKVALARLGARSLALGGQRYFAPNGWSILPGTPAQLVDAQSGARATLILLANIKPQQALLQALTQRLPVPPETLAALLASSSNKPTAPAQNAPNAASREPLRVELLDCPGLLCIEAGPNQEFTGLLPTLHAGVLDLNPGSLVIVLEDALRVQVQAVLKALFAAGLVTEESKP